MLPFVRSLRETWANIFTRPRSSVRESWSSIYHANIQILKAMALSTSLQCSSDIRKALSNVMLRITLKEKSIRRRQKPAAQSQVFILASRSSHPSASLPFPTMPQGLLELQIEVTFPHVLIRNSVYCFPRWILIHNFTANRGTNCPNFNPTNFVRNLTNANPLVSIWLVPESPDEKRSKANVKRRDETNPVVQKPQTPC